MHKQNTLYQKRIQHAAGFSLIETLVSLFILTLTLGGFISLVTTSLRSFDISKQSSVAGRVAQEGMELAISKRDNHVACVEDDSNCPISDWKENLLGNFEVGSADLNRLKPTLSFKSFDSTRVLCIIDTPAKNAGKFGYCSGGENSGTIIQGDYTREVQITALGPEKVLVRSIVQWKKRNTTETLILEEVLFGSLTEGAAVPPPDISLGLVGHWELDEISGTLASDSGTGGNGGVLTSMDFASNGVAGTVGSGALDFDGVNDYVDANNVGVSWTTVFNDIDDFTIALWVRPDTVGAGDFSSLVAQRLRPHAAMFRSQALLRSLDYRSAYHPYLRITFRHQIRLRHPCQKPSKSRISDQPMN